MPLSPDSPSVLSVGFASGLGTSSSGSSSGPCGTTYVPMSEEDWEETIDLFAELLNPSASGCLKGAG